MKLTTATVRTQPLPDGKNEAIFFDDDIPGLDFACGKAAPGTSSFSTSSAPSSGVWRSGKQPLIALPNPQDRGQALCPREARRRSRNRQGASAAAGLRNLRPGGERISGYTAPEVPAELVQRNRAASDQVRKAAAPTAGRQDRPARYCRSDRESHKKQRRRDGEPCAIIIVDLLFVVCSARSGAGESGHRDGEERETSRERVLAPAELRLIWNALPDDQFGDIVRLLALTAQREAEIGALSKTEITDELIVLPSQRTKNKRAHVIPLSGAAAAIINRQPERDGRELLFGNGEGGFSGWSNCKERLDAAITKANDGKPIQHWTLHDLRRTFATYAGGGLPAHQLEKLPKQDKEIARGLGIQPHVIEAVLNHVSGHKAGVAGIYNRSSYEREKRQALDLWADHLIAIVESRTSNITPLRREA